MMNVHVSPRDRRAPASAALTLDELYVERDGRRILDGVSFDIARGRVTAIVGRSGAGKTTLIKVLNGLIAPTRGSIRAPDLGLLADATSWTQMRRQTATIFQDHALIGRLGALDNVLLGLADERHPLSPAPWSRALRERAAQALRDVGMLSRAFERVEKFSGGEQQRIGIARALCRRPKLLLGDEPFSSLDPPLARHLGEDLRALSTRNGVTVVLVLHQMSLARALSDRIVAIDRGSVVFDGETRAFDARAQARAFPSFDVGSPK